MGYDPFGVGEYPPSQVISSGADLEGLSPAARKMLEGITGAYKKPIKVVSGYRSPSRNARVGGAKRSQHINGNAVDISLDDLPDDEKAQILAAAVAAGAKGVGIYPGGSLHVDTRENPALWGMREGAAYSGMPLDMAPEWGRDALRPLFGEKQAAPQTMAYGGEPPPERPIGAVPGQGSLGAPPDFAQQYRSGPVQPPPDYSMQFKNAPPAPPRQAIDQMAAQPGGDGQMPEVTVTPGQQAAMPQPRREEDRLSQIVGHPVYAGGGGNYYFDDPLSGRAMPANSDPRLMALVQAILGGGNGGGGNGAA